MKNNAFPKKDREVLEKAVALATELHKEQKRASGKPYITHPIAVMEILKKLNFPPIALAIAVLHDVCEDTKITNIDMYSLFPERVVFVVYALSKNQKPKDNQKWRKFYQEAKQRKEEGISSFEAYIDYRFTIYMRRFYLGCLADPYVMYVKMADQIHNLSDMKFLPESKRKRKIWEVENHFLPLYRKMQNAIMPDSFDQYSALLSLLENTLQKSS
ncbi:bifunctional (p)ppGpp synthetase/guanosine-3',5'-bis(diphosphate) 3'-pyrophosphohydrolase [Candidatus Peregrinibacteria bacterium]|nr:MAG: bifunctional (p)ppGpp synthetase/guanosine-3',5'-bis(diphosphate) 3'-pyrophosphohydrolase [Candidatus Peregrinibacteria bacterium]